MITNNIRKAATGQSIGHRTNFSGPDVRKVRGNAPVHLTRGEPYSRTGFNVKALCGASVRPTLVDAEDHPVCRKCQAATA